MQLKSDVKCKVGLVHPGSETESEREKLESQEVEGPAFFFQLYFKHFKRKKKENNQKKKH